MNAMTKVADYYSFLMEKADPRLDDFFMMSSPIPCLVITAAWIYLVKSGLPQFMKNRSPYNIRGLMVVYNFAMVLFSGYMALEFGLSGWFTNYTFFGCEPVDYSNKPQALRMLSVSWLFYISKLVELIDTIFFVLRKKESHVTFLHMVHHGFMPISYWYGIKFVAGGFGTFHTMVNSFVHFVMYFYYGVAAMGPQYQKYLWWKKYLTKLQMTQFVVCSLHACQLFFIECSFPVAFTIWILLPEIAFLFMFADFYIKAYKKNKMSKAHSNGIQSNGVHSNGVHSNGVNSTNGVLTNGVKKTE